MAKRTSYEIMKKLLLKVEEDPATYAELERKMNTGYRTVKMNSELLEDLGQVRIEAQEDGRRTNTVRITPQGRQSLKRMKSRNS